MRTLSCLTLLFLALFQSQTSFSALIMSLRNHHSHPQHRRPMFQTNQTTCALFAGTWVHDDSYPLYQYSSCPAIDAQFNCQLCGRPDSDYLKYRWQPLNCQLPRFDGVTFLAKMRGKNLMFVGDSLGRNQWESLICMILAGDPQTQTQMNRAMPLSTFKFLEYGITMSYFRAPYLVDIDVVQGKKIVKLDDIAGNGNAWRMADVLIFNTGHWWTHVGSLQGWDMIQSGGKYYQDMDRLVAMEKGLRTWANWVDTNVDISRTRVFFQSISPDHYDPNEWGAGATAMTTKNCYGETTPMKGTTYTSAYADQTRVLDEVMREMHVPVYLLDITMLSQLRKDGHPSIYSGDISPSQRANGAKSADCSHWCLPGLPDTWNELFYTVLFY
ncbi:TRICHOME BIREFRINGENCE-LIKE 44, POWDERY MILDEW RESISTANT 5 [Hibiscus trionum]|uniref:TRICHOME BIREFRINGENCE-LIKE 44, POWDERY MILDEW RESISTANT 5 n=1 Tax=Hibiscus trionum TaxID=183268 RepID=A0A9W7I4W8_HIBTR|nr:TRICHOME BIREFRINGENCE-LIKE 44, POWDERY MILDEW RESISTANT 5 [Hibiscus trionum]